MEKLPGFINEIPIDNMIKNDLGHNPFPEDQSFEG